MPDEDFPKEKSPEKAGFILTEWFCLIIIKWLVCGIPRVAQEHAQRHIMKLQGVFADVPYLPAQEASAQQGARLPCPYVHQERPPRAGRPPPSRPQGAQRLSEKGRLLHKRRSVKPAPFLISGEVGPGFSDTRRNVVRFMKPLWMIPTEPYRKDDGRPCKSRTDWGPTGSSTTCTAAERRPPARN